VNATLNRRSFLKLAGITGASLALGVHLPDSAGAASLDADVPIVNLARAADSFEPNIYLVIYADNSILVRIHRSEMGQGVTTSLAMIIADELEADWSQLRTEQSPADRAYGDQVTGGSQSISGSYFVLRAMGASARTMLITAGAQVMGVDPSVCYAELGEVVDSTSGTRIPYGQLVEIASTLPVPKRSEYTLKEPAQFRYMGTAMGNWHNADFVTGAAQFCSDLHLPGMVVAMIARPPVVDATIESYDDTAARAVEGVLDVLMVQDWLTVIAEDTWSAIKGREALNITWTGGKTTLNTAQVRADYEARNDLSPSEGVLKAQYYNPFEAHATMEPMVCVADVQGERAEGRAPTQERQSAQRAATHAAGISTANLTLHVPLIGGAFGRRLQVDYVSEAVSISRAVGRPVKLVWTREEDMQNDYYHPLCVSFVSQPLDTLRVPRRQGRTSNEVPTGAWRSVENFPDAFAIESFVDEFAYARGMDPLELRLQIYAGSRQEAVLRLAAEKAGWGDPLPENWGRGVAVYSTFGVTHVAMIGEVEVTAQGRVIVHRVVCAVDCGVAVNFDGIRAQMEGGIAFGLTAALKAGISIEGGRIQQSNFHDYPLLRYDEMPQVEIYVVESDPNPTGIGEMGVPPVPPMIANAIYAATGKRIRHIPILPEDLR